MKFEKSKNLGEFMMYQLRKHGIRIAYEGPDNVLVYCVGGHDVRTPSLSIDKIKGRFNCFGCGLKGQGWNHLAKIIGAEQLKPGSRPDPAGVLSQEIRKHLDSTNGQTKLQWNELPWDIEPWSKPWKKISAYTMNAATAYEWYDDKDKCYRLLLPIYMFGALNGFVARRLDKGGSKKIRKYRNSIKFGSKRLLYPVDIVEQMNTTSVALVEGPKDALRCVDEDIPALCNFGGKGSWSKFKVTILANLGIKRVVIASDKDEAGEAFRAKLSTELKPLFKLDHFYCPTKKRDPGNLRKTEYKELWKMVNEG
jgi:5S rRNA maturation endonuclease (ribonuclease M5)